MKEKVKLFLAKEWILTIVFVITLFSLVAINEFLAKPTKTVYDITGNSEAIENLKNMSHEDRIKIEQKIRDGYNNNLLDKVYYKNIITVDINKKMKDSIHLKFNDGYYFNTHSDNIFKYLLSIYLIIQGGRLIFFLTKKSLQVIKTSDSQTPNN